MKKIALVISCEHAVDSVPKEFLHLFKPFHALLNSHRGIDFGAFVIAQYLQEQLSCDFIQAHTTRLLIDCNRSLNHSSCFSEVTRDLPFTEKELIINQYYLPFREQVTAAIKTHVAEGSAVWHLSIHSFTPVMDNIERTADIGLLYDPKRFGEKQLAKQWQKEIKTIAPEMRVRMNYPYKGTSDGFTTALRKQFSAAEYVGIEVESNQALTKESQSLNKIKNLLALSLLKLIC